MIGALPADAFHYHSLGLEDRPLLAEHPSSGAADCHIDRFLTSQHFDVSHAGSPAGVLRPFNSTLPPETAIPCGIAAERCEPARAPPVS